MGKLWDWFRGKGRANAKSVADGAVDPPVPEPQKSTPRQVDAAVEKAEDKWEKDGNRADQDYYHVPGARDQGLKGEPEAQRNPARKPRAPRRTAKPK